VTNGAITFDFHNTLATCDTWFHLEVRTLASAFLQWEAAARGATVRPELVAAADLAYRRLRQAIHSHGHELPSERCVAVVLDRLGIHTPAERIAYGVDHVMDAALADVQPVAGAVETVGELAARGVKLGIVSSAVHHPFLEATLERFGIRGAFQVVTTSASTGYYKSRPEIFWHTLNQLDASPGRSVHIGDSLRFDVGGAQRAGMRTVLVASHAGERDHQTPRPDLVLSSLCDASSRILDLLRHSGQKRECSRC
jgi:FMN phosphatase YigB (HAD superfamily)